MDSLAPRMHVAGKYVLERPLARGAMGEVWIATHASLGGEVAIKFLAQGPAHDGEDEATAMARFRFEAQIAAKLSRKTRHIVGVTDHGDDRGRAYLVMELVAGESLEALMLREPRCSLQALAPIVAQLGKGLAAAHAEGVFHRDLKPANVLLARDEDGGLLVKILDFGIAKTVRHHKVSGAGAPGHETETGIVLGTPNYMSPEQARGLATLDHRCDLWALATVAYEALTGTLPYDGETTADLLVNICSVEPVPVRTHRPDLPESADAFFRKAFAASPSRRFQDAASLASAFAAVVADAEQGAPLPLVVPKERPVELSPASYEPPRRSPAILIALALVVLASVVFVAIKLNRKPAAAPPVATTTPIATSPTAPPEPTPTPAAPPEPAPEQKSIAVKPAVTAKPIPAKPPPSAAPSPKKPLDKGEIL